jgi:chemotaxis protein MotB
LKNAPGFNDNYELSFARALGVGRFLRERGGESVGRYEIAARGPVRPVATNETDEGRQANQRIEVYVYGPLSPRESEEVGADQYGDFSSSQGT